MTRSRLVRAALAAALIAVLVMTGCAKKPAAEKTSPGTPPKEYAGLTIGVLPTEDSLPLWIAEKEGIFGAAGIKDVKIVMFQSAQERDAAFSSGAIDAYMGDLIATTNLEAGGAPATVLFVMLGSDQSQGRFGVVASPKGGPATLAEAAKAPIGTSSATIQEYVLDGLLTEAGIDPAKVKKEEVKKVPVRFELLMKGQLKSAMLPEPFLSLAEKGGAKVLADDTKAKQNLSQTVLVVSDKYLDNTSAENTSKALAGVWDEAVGRLLADPEKYRSLLVEKARLPEALAKTYKINTYPSHGLPQQADVDAVLTWMKGKKLLKTDVTYEDLTVLPQPTK